MDFEKLGAFYLGKEYAFQEKHIEDRLVMYDARDLTTHAVCVGMTGSGKTGLCLDLLEEAALDHVPALIIDPKGDITNLLLTFPELAAEDFRPWINVEDARRKGLTEDAFAAQQAELWRNGLAEWGQDGERIRMLRETTDFMICTPGSDAGLPVSILQSFAAPSLSWESEAETLRERIQGTVSALLGLIGIEADPVRSREHILLSTLFEHFWRKGEDLDLAKLILSLQDPPVRKLGVFDVDTFFPQKERLDLAMQLNNIIAAPSFQSWLQGQPMDIPGFLATPEGKPRHTIFYIAHLSEPERMFFVTMLLNQFISWMRGQQGTSSLRALLYMDEVFGFFPPSANPPSKKPLLTLMKQARAFGVGVVLTTQNPVDLDYKGLSNAGTWFIGRLQTERDKARLLEGLESASSNTETVLDRQALDKLIGGLDKRVFLLHNVHEAAPVPFYTRWAMSYLRGPLTRMQVRELMRGRSADVPLAAPKDGTGIAPSTAAPIAPRLEAVDSAPEAKPVAAKAPAELLPNYQTTPPNLSASIQQVYLPLQKSAAAVAMSLEQQASDCAGIVSQSIVYVPALLAMGQVFFVKQTQALRVNEAESFALLAQPPQGVGVLRWDQAQTLALTPRDLLDRPEAEALFDVLPETINESKELTGYQHDLEDHLYHSSSLVLHYSPAVKLYSKPGEDARAFRLRAGQAARELRDADVDKLQARYAKKIKTLEDRLIRAQAAMEKKEASAAALKQDALLSAGETILSLFGGRRRSISTAARRVTRSSSAHIDVDAAAEQVEVLQADIAALQQELKQESDDIVARWEAALEKLEDLPIMPRRSDVDVRLFALAWGPQWVVLYKNSQGVVQKTVVPGY